MVVIVLLLLRSETRSSGGLIGCSGVAVTPETRRSGVLIGLVLLLLPSETQQWRADWLLLCRCYSVRRHAAVEG